MIGRRDYKNLLQRVKAQGAACVEISQDLSRTVLLSSSRGQSRQRTAGGYVALDQCIPRTLGMGKYLSCIFTSEMEFLTIWMLNLTEESPDGHSKEQLRSLPMKPLHARPP